MRNLCALIVIAAMLFSLSVAAERKSLKEVDADAFIADTQVAPKGTGDSHLALVWWIPNEFWESILSRDATTSEADKKAMLDAMEGVTLLVIVQADITQFGAMRFYSREEIERSMVLSFADGDDTRHALSLVREIDPDLEVILSIFRPILGSAMGNLGNNMQFYVLDNKTPSSEALVSPYEKGRIDARLSKRDGSLMEASIELPINALFVPRLCPNGREAHISWKYCPWTGQKLDD